MVRIAGIILPGERKINIGLTAIFGIGRKVGNEILSQTKIDSNKRVKDLSSEEITKLQKIIDQYVVEGILRQRISDDIKRLKSTGSYRGIRHQQGLPVRGQRTRSNARTKRGRRRTVGAIKKKELARKTDAKKEKKE